MAKVTERMRDSGTVLRNGQEVCQARYDLSVVQDEIVAETFGSRQTIAGKPGIQGSVSPVGNVGLELGTTYTLRLADGREVDFFVTHDRPPAYPIAQVSELRPKQ